MLHLVILMFGPCMMLLEPKMTDGTATAGVLDMVFFQLTVIDGHAQWMRNNNEKVNNI